MRSRADVDMAFPPDELASIRVAAVCANPGPALERRTSGPPAISTFAVFAFHAPTRTPSSTGSTQQRSRGVKDHHTREREKREIVFSKKNKETPLPPLLLFRGLVLL